MKRYHYRSARNEAIEAMAYMRSMIKPFLFLVVPLFLLYAMHPASDQSAIAQSALTTERVTVILKDFYVHPNITQAKTGWITLDAVNEGASTHELVILRTQLNPAALPRKEATRHQGSAREYLVNEDDAHIETIDEIEEFPAGTSQEKTVFLEPGHYVLFCNIPGHYDKGMYASLHILP